MYLYIIIFLLLLFIIYLFYNQSKLKKEKQILEDNRIEELKSYFRKEWEEEEKELRRQEELTKSILERDFKEFEYRKKENQNQLNNLIEKLEVQLKEKEARYNEVNQDLNLYKEGKIKEIDSGLEEVKKKKEILLDNEFKEKRDGRLKEFDEMIQFLTEQEQNFKKEIEELKLTLEDYRTRRAAINEEILRQKQLEEQQDFYRIQLNPNEIGDIEILRTTAARLQRPEIINKIIWSGYYQKPLAELRKRLLPNGDISGIYKITRLKTKEIYIGQSTSLDKRWQEHVKSALGVGILASSQLHRVMALDGPEQFTFEVLEETPKDKLRERESYYIDFYDSKNYGLNTIKGDK